MVLSRLPDQVRTVLANSTTESNDELGVEANQVMEAYLLSRKNNALAPAVSVVEPAADRPGPTPFNRRRRRRLLSSVLPTPVMGTRHFHADLRSAPCVTRSSRGRRAFQRLMDGMLRHITFAFVYLDDILVASPSPEMHKRHLHELFCLLEQNGININRKNCTFGQNQVYYLCHLVDGDGIQPLPSRVDDLRNLPAPDSRLSVQRFLGMIYYYRRFVPKMAQILGP